MSIEAMKQALEALEFFKDTAVCSADTDVADEAITSLKQAIASLQQEPVGYVYSVSGEKIKNAAIKKDIPNGTFLYTHPQPKAEQSPLTDEQIVRGLEAAGVEFTEAGDFGMGPRTPTAAHRFMLQLHSATQV